MFRGWKSILRLEDDPTPRRRERRCLPTLAGSASCLEDRVLLSGASAHAAEVAKTAANLANTHAGHIVTSLYESIIGTDPTSAQLTTWVHKLHSGVSSKVLRKDLVATARVDQLKAADPPVTAVNVSTTTPASGLTIFGSSSTTTGTSVPTITLSSPAAVPSLGMTAVPFVSALTSPTTPGTVVGLNVQQAPDLSALRAGLSGGSGLGSTASSGSGHASGGTVSATTGTTTSSASTSTAGSTSTTSASPLQSLDSAGSVPTPGLTTSTGSIASVTGQLTQSQLTQSQLTQSQLAITPALTVSTTAPDAAATGLTIAPTTGLTTTPSTGLTIAPSTGLTIAPSSNLI